MSIKKVTEFEQPVDDKGNPVKTVKASELDQLVAQFKKDKGEGVVIMGNQVPIVKRQPTGIHEFDLGTGGGFPCGRYSILYGPEGSTKTGHALAAIARAQQRPPPCNKAVLVDLEGTYDQAWGAMYGIDNEKLVILKPGTGEQAVDLMQAVIHADDVAIVVLDSLAVVVSTKELEQTVEKFDVGTAAILIKRMCNKLTLGLQQEEKRGHTPCVILINQTRFKVGVMFGDPETIPGGQTMKFLSSLTIRVYGKNVVEKAVHPDLAAFKNIMAVVKKAKVPITKLAMEYNLCMYPHGHLKVGQTDSWNSVMSDLKSLGYLTKIPKGWQLIANDINMTQPTLTVFQDTYDADDAFSLKLKQLVVNSNKGSMFLVAATDAAQ
jgi:recombination protein RecA